MSTYAYVTNTQRLQSKLVTESNREHKIPEQLVGE